MKAKVFQPRNSNTTSPPSSTRSAAKWKRGAVFPQCLAGHTRNCPPAPHWRHHQFASARSFFCQIEAVETAIWLTRSPRIPLRQAPARTPYSANKDANPALMRLALKLATGAGKTTVMAMLIAWQTNNAIRRPAANISPAGLHGERCFRGPGAVCSC